MSGMDGMDGMDGTNGTNAMGAMDGTNAMDGTDAMDEGAYRAERFEAGRHLTGLVSLFVAAHCPCFCRYWHFDGDKNAWLERCSIGEGENEAELDRAAMSGTDEARGVVALPSGSDEVVGWAKVAPAATLVKLYEQRYYRGLPSLVGDREGVFTVGCMLVHPDRRHQGAARALARGAVEAARAWGASALEAFPRLTTDPVADEEIWMGPYAALVEAGLEPVDDARPYPVLRLDLRR
jgi:GNAT superfamily N-acetyltransferase